MKRGPMHTAKTIQLVCLIMLTWGTLPHQHQVETASYNAPPPAKALRQYKHLENEKSFERKENLSSFLDAVFYRDVYL